LGNLLKELHLFGERALCILKRALFIVCMRSSSTWRFTHGALSILGLALYLPKRALLIVCMLSSSTWRLLTVGKSTQRAPFIRGKSPVYIEKSPIYCVYAEQQYMALANDWKLYTKSCIYMGESPGYAETSHVCWIFVALQCGALANYWDPHIYIHGMLWKEADIFVCWAVVMGAGWLLGFLQSRAKMESDVRYAYSICIHICIQIFVHIYIYMCICMWICTFMNMYIYWYI